MSRKQVYKGKTLFKKTVVDNIIRTYENSTFDFSTNWYEDASDLARGLSIEFNVDYLKVCGIIAALSPLKTWDENKKLATIFLRTGKARHTTLCEGKAIAIANLSSWNLPEAIAEVLNGNKIKSFFINIAFPTNNEVVTIDRHALSICLNRSIVSQDYVGITNIQYSFFVGCYIEAGIILNARPSAVQSVTWEKWRMLKKQTN
jgi:hypothetical protein